MNESRKQIGDGGEDFACLYLKNNSWKIVKKNIRLLWGDEIDLLAYDPSGILVFVEIKTVTVSGISAEEQMTRAKIKKCIRSATWYANQFPELINERKGWRIDCVALTKREGAYSIKHYKQIV